METPMYKMIAIDIAQRIVNHEFGEGSKLSGRSLLAGRYNVSPETIRKSIALLKDGQVVFVSQGKEVKIVSLENAHKFLERYRYSQSVDMLKEQVEDILERKRALDLKLEDLLMDIIRYSDCLKNLTPYHPVEIEVPPNSHIIAQKIRDLKFWQNTGATIVAIRRREQVIVSPGPDACMQAYDKIVIVGDHDILKRTNDFLFL